MIQNYGKKTKDDEIKVFEFKTEKHDHEIFSKSLNKDTEYSKR